MVKTCVIILAAIGGTLLACLIAGIPLIILGMSRLTSPLFAITICEATPNNGTTERLYISRRLAPCPDKESLTFADLETVTVTIPAKWTTPWNKYSQGLLRLLEQGQTAYLNISYTGPGVEVLGNQEVNLILEDVASVSDNAFTNFGRTFVYGKKKFRIIDPNNVDPECRDITTGCKQELRSVELAAISTTQLKIPQSSDITLNVNYYSLNKNGLTSSTVYVLMHSLDNPLRLAGIVLLAIVAVALGWPCVGRRYR
eukprot:TRINITY_DN6671_c0_g1_i2.p1 TRINITY_DN6671_c0_g1~~TRINITY_DN6671_c0_g1_i2.p1  ORF type:complete len:263 (-),score=23.53 TRINITY_DN6671_c0_g1_i2:131-898(-)